MDISQAVKELIKHHESEINKIPFANKVSIFVIVFFLKQMLKIFRNVAC